MYFYIDDGSLWIMEVMEIKTPLTKKDFENLSFEEIESLIVMHDDDLYACGVCGYETEWKHFIHCLSHTNPATWCPKCGKIAI